MFRSKESEDLVIVTDSGKEFHGVNNTIRHTVECLRSHFPTVRPIILNRDDFPVIPNPFYPSLPFAVPSVGAIRKRFEAEGVVPTRARILLTVEGPLGWMARAFCLQEGYRFSTAFTTRFDLYLKLFARIPEAATWHGLRRFHSAAESVLPPSASIAELLRSKGIGRVGLWSRGVDRELFRPRRKNADIPRPLILTVGRISREKNIPALLDSSLPGTIWVVGDGPARSELELRYKSQIRSGRVVFLGKKHGEELACLYSEADVFAFTSTTDTLGNVNLESLASGTPIAGFPAPGISDLVNHGAEIGAVHRDLDTAISKALIHGRSSACVELASRYTWKRATEQLLNQTFTAIGS